MKALISAAGLGSRLGELTRNTNKCLLQIGGVSLLRHAVNTLNANGINKIFVIVGYHADKVIEELGSDVTYIHNESYATTSILGSVALGKEHLEGEEFIFMTGDSFMHPNVIRDFLKEDAEVLASIELKECDEEDYKVILKDGAIVAMSKNIPTNEADGEFTAMIKVGDAASYQFFENVEFALNNETDEEYVADMILKLQDQGFAVKPVFSNTYPRIEIDFKEDLEKARKIYSEYFE